MSFGQPVHLLLHCLDVQSPQMFYIQAANDECTCIGLREQDGRGKVGHYYDFAIHAVMLSHISGGMFKSMDPLDL